MDGYTRYLANKDSSNVWSKAKQLEFGSIDQIVLALGNPESLTWRNAMTLRILGLIGKPEQGSDLEVDSTPAGDYFLASTDKQAVLDEQLLKIFLSSYVNPKMTINVFPMGVIYRILAEHDYLTFTEYMLFICWINDDDDEKIAIELIKEYRNSDGSRKVLYESVLIRKTNELGYSDFKDHIHRLFNVFKLSSFINSELPGGRWSDVLMANSQSTIYRSLADSIKSINLDNYEHDHTTHLGIVEVSPEYTDITKEIATLTPDEQKIIKTQIRERNKLPDLAQLVPVKIGAQFLDVEPRAKATPGNTKTTSVKIDYDQRNKRNRLVGAFGERVVMKYEYTNLVSAGRLDLLSKLEHCSLTDDSLGYDIKSRNTDGTEKHIEVKTVSGKPRSFRFYISANELEKVNNDPHHYVYLVFKYDSLSPQILEIGNLKENIESHKTTLNAVNYTVTVNLQYED